MLWFKGVAETMTKAKRLNFEQQMEQAILEINIIDFSLA